MRPHGVSEGGLPLALGQGAAAFAPFLRGHTDIGVTLGRCPVRVPESAMVKLGGRASERGRESSGGPFELALGALVLSDLSSLLSGKFSRAVR